VIVVKIFGGFGNQLFQYAMALKIAKKNKNSLILDSSWFDSTISYATKRNFDLKFLNLSIDTTIRFNERIKLLFYNNSLLKKIPFKRKLRILNDNDPICFEELDNVYLNGYWHSYKYFDDVKDDLFNDFSLKYNIDINSDFRNQILSENNSVSIHIRRTDYVNNPFYAQCSMQYFQNAMNLIAKKIENPVFFIFSDDLDYVKKNLKINNTVYYALNKNTEISTIEDFFNMQSCKHHIISNSTFSWWASWLNPNPNKIVVIPKHWYTNPDEDSSGYYLDSYIISDNVH
jgi:hypothetical protein